MDILKNCVVLGILSCGMLLVVLTLRRHRRIRRRGHRGVRVYCGRSSCRFRIIFLALLVGVGAGALMELANGLLVARLQIPHCSHAGHVQHHKRHRKICNERYRIAVSPEFYRFGQSAFSIPRWTALQSGRPAHTGGVPDRCGGRHGRF